MADDEDGEDELQPEPEPELELEPSESYESDEESEDDEPAADFSEAVSETGWPRRASRVSCAAGPATSASAGRLVGCIFGFHHAGIGVGHDAAAKSSAANSSGGTRAEGAGRSKPAER